MVKFLLFHISFLPYSFDLSSVIKNQFVNNGSNRMYFYVFHFFFHTIKSLIECQWDCPNIMFCSNLLTFILKPVFESLRQSSHVEEVHYTIL